jgi:nicotinic acid phosphoribosyltransferase
MKTRRQLTEEIEKRQIMITFIKGMVAAMADSYKYGHFEQYDEADEMVAYGECRGPLTPEDGRIVFIGMRQKVEEFLYHRWTHEELDLLASFMLTHNAGNTPYPWPEKLFRQFVDENDGYFPVTIQAMPEGSVIQPHVPVYQITAKKPYAALVTFLETLLTKVWYPTVVCTLDRNVWQSIYDGYVESVDEEDWWTLDYRLHDFGMRGCTSEDQAITGGMAHLVNFKGSDTVSAALYAQFLYNEGRPVAESIPATEHSVMTARGRKGELGRVLKIIGLYAKGVFATVMDSFDSDNFLNEIVPKGSQTVKDAGGLWVGRPDSGDPVDEVMKTLRKGAATFGTRTNRKGYRVILNWAAIQGDGIDPAIVIRIIKAVLYEGFSLQNIAFGMGGGLLQKVNRDTLRFATKLCYIKYSDGTWVEVMKDPKGDIDKCSLAGKLSVRRTVFAGRPYTVVPVPAGWSDHDAYYPEEILQVVYDCGPIEVEWPTFDQLRQRVNAEWAASDKVYDPRSEVLMQKIAEIRAQS